MALNAAIEGKTINLTQASMNNLLKQLNLSSLFSPEISLKSSVGGELEYELRLVHKFSNVRFSFCNFIKKLEFQNLKFLFFSFLKGGFKLQDT